jgi:hypothetical protein
MITIMSKKQYESIMYRRTLEDSDIVFIAIGPDINGFDRYKVVKNRFATEQGKIVGRAEATNMIEAYIRLIS